MLIVALGEDGGWGMRGIKGSICPWQALPHAYVGVILCENLDCLCPAYFSSKCMRKFLECRKTAVAEC